MWCKWLKVTGNEQPETQSPVSTSPCAGGPLSWCRSILFSQQKPKNPKIQHSVHRRSAVGDACNYHPFLKRDFPCRKWLFYGNALNPCNHANPFPTLMVQLGAFLEVPAKKAKQEQSNSVSADTCSDRHSHYPGTATFIYYFGKKTLRHQAVADARIQVPLQLILLPSTSTSTRCLCPGLITSVHLLQVGKGKKLS